MTPPSKVLSAVFFRSTSGTEPVRDWLLSLDRADKKIIGSDIATLEFCWPIGKPKCSPIVNVKGMYEVRSKITGGRIARILFIIDGSQMVLLHGFVKKSQKTPLSELNLAKNRLKEFMQ